MIKDLVTIIVPVYKVDVEYFKRCILSLMKQTYEALEILLIDDGSYDLCSDMCDEYANKDARIKVIHKENEGVSATRNYGLDIANGEYIVFVDSDDYLDIHYIEKLYTEIKGYDVCCSGHTKLFTQKQELHAAFNYSFKYNMDVIGTVWGKMYRQDLIADQRFDVNLTRCEDIEFNLRVFKGANYVYIEDYGYFYRYHLSSAVRKFDQEAIQKYMMTIEKIHDQDLSEAQLRAYYVIVCTIARVVIETFILKQDKKLKYKLQDLKQFVAHPYLEEAFQKVNLNDFSTTRRVPIIGLRKHRYELVYLPIYVRDLQYTIYGKGK